MFGLSLFGLAMGLGTVFGIPWKTEPLFWLVIFITSAFVMARQAPSRPFLHGFLLGIVNSVWVTAAHILFYNRYLARHPIEAAMMERLQASPRLAKVGMALDGLASGLIYGVVIGVLAYAVAKVLKSQDRGASMKTRRARARS